MRRASLLRALRPRGEKLPAKRPFLHAKNHSVPEGAAWGAVVVLQSSGLGSVIQLARAKRPLLIEDRSDQYPLTKNSMYERTDLFADIANLMHKSLRKLFFPGAP